MLDRSNQYLLENPMFAIAIKPLRQWMWHNYVIFTPSTRHRLTPVYPQTPRRMRVHVILLHHTMFSLLLRTAMVLIIVDTLFFGLDHGLYVTLITRHHLCESLIKVFQTVFVYNKVAIHTSNT